MGIRIKLVVIDGQKQMPPECMRILTEFAGHRDCCDQCVMAFRQRTDRYCATGGLLLRELAAQPEVEQT